MEWLWSLLALAAVCAIWGILIERHLYRVREESILDALPAGSTPIRVLHISDIHLAPWQKRKAAWVAGLTRLNADLVVNTGDNMSHRNVIDQAIAMLNPLGATPGVFVNGSNDYHAPTVRNPLAYLRSPSNPENGTPLDTQRFTDALEATGWKNLNNKSATLEINGVKLGFLGLDDPHDNLHEPRTLAAQAKTIDGANLVIGVTHAPYIDVLGQLAGHGARLIFAGHTHGGQVCLPGGRAIITNCDLPAKYARGISAWNFEGAHTILNVCAGLGTSIFAPVRFFCQPEVRLITLLPATN